MVNREKTKSKETWKHINKDSILREEVNSMIEEQFKRPQHLDQSKRVH